MRPYRCLVGLLIAAAIAITVPAQSALAAAPAAPPHRTAPVLTDTQVDRVILQDAKADFLGGRRRIHRNRNADWWVQWIGPGRYWVIRYTWSGTWRVRKGLDHADNKRAGAAAACSFLPRPINAACGAGLLLDYWYVSYMTNRALRNHRCLVLMVKQFSFYPMPPMYFRTTRCVR